MDVSEMKPTLLKTEYTVNPLGIDVLRPGLSWVSVSDSRDQKQTAYQVLVSSSENNLSANIGDLWDSAKVDSDRSVCILYDGSLPASGKRYYWKVRVWDKSDMPSEWSENAWWETGLLNRSDWYGQWIGYACNDESHGSGILLRKEFPVTRQIKSARVYICGLGYYELRINGTRVGDHVLDPGFTKYDRTILYVTYDITGLLSTGLNAVAVELGRGFYGITTLSMFELNKASWHSNPKMLLQMNICFDDGSNTMIISDDSWKVSDGPIIFDSLYAGETYDARKEKARWDMPEYDESSWSKASIVEAPTGRLKDQILPPIKVIGTIMPSGMSNLKPDVYLFSFERNITGWIKLKVSGPKGMIVTVKYGEKLDAEVNFIDPEHEHVYSRLQVDTYILKGQGIETWEPRFSYKGFQYVEISGLAYTPALDDVEAKIVHSAVEPAGSFTCSNELFNKIHVNTCNTILNNLHSIPTDTPVYEKNGWLGDACLIAETSIYNFDMHQFFTKWMNDIRDCQNEEGLVPLIAPSEAWGMWHSPEWGAAYIFIPWNLYHYYGNKGILDDHYSSMKKYIEYSISKLDDFISPSVLGDWLAPGSTGRPPEGSALSATAYIYACIKIMCKVAGLLGRTDDSLKYEDISYSIKNAFNCAFLDKVSNIYYTGIDAGYRQTSNILPVAFGMVPDENKKPVIENLVKDVFDRGGHLNTGILGTRYLLEVLADNGYGDVAYTIASQTGYPGWGYWIANGATTNWENWELNGRSRNHYMFGAIDGWFYKYFTGISAASPGFKSIVIKPHIFNGLMGAAARMESVHGTISSEWIRNSDNTVRLNIIIPVNTTATVYVPALNAKSVKEGGIEAVDAAGVTFLRNEPGYVIFAVGSGIYEFASKIEQNVK